MERQVLEASKREETGKGAARSLRREGVVPGVVYGQHQDVVCLSVDEDALEEMLQSQAGENIVIDLEIEGVDPPEDSVALLKEIQRHPITRDAESVDFQWVSLKEKIDISVELIVEGHSPAEEEGAVINQTAYDVEVSCLPTDIPDQVVMSIEGMELHETRRAGQIELPEGVELRTDPETPVVTCVPPARIEEPEPERGLLEEELELVAEGEELLEAEELLEGEEEELEPGEEVEEAEGEEVEEPGEE